MIFDVERPNQNSRRQKFAAALRDRGVASNDVWCCGNNCGACSAYTRIVEVFLGTVPLTRSWHRLRYPLDVEDRISGIYLNRFGKA